LLLFSSEKRRLFLTIFIGISGWTYAPWRGVFYPRGLRQSEELAYAASQFSSIEINGTFYGLQKPDAFAAWADAVPEGFVFAVKAPRFITHIKRLRDVEAPVANFLASGVLRLGAALGPILWQLPPNFRFEAERLEAFLALLPHDTTAAARLAKQHDSRVDGRDWARTDAARPLRHAMEVRHESFRDAGFVELLRRYAVALVCADSVAWPRLADVTADFVYCRLHGAEELYASGYGEAEIAAWAGGGGTWAAGGTPDDLDRLAAKAGRRKRDVFVYFDNDQKVLAPRDARRLSEVLGVAGLRK
jgi:uncharacterized protein YecE (DUF72 family)